MKISVSELQNLISYGLTWYSDDCIDINYDYYWNILHSDKFNLSKKPSLAVGSLDDDVKHLREFFSEDLPFGEMEISRLAAMLKLLADHIETTTG